MNDGHREAAQNRRVPAFSKRHADCDPKQGRQDQYFRKESCLSARQSRKKSSYLIGNKRPQRGKNHKHKLIDQAQNNRLEYNLRGFRFLAKDVTRAHGIENKSRQKEPGEDIEIDRVDQFGH